MLMMGHCRSCVIISAKMTLRLGIETLPVNIEIGGGGGISLNILLKPRFLVAKLFPSAIADDTRKASKQLREDMFFFYIFSFSSDYSLSSCARRNFSFLCKKRIFKVCLMSFKATKVESE
jgi:hypothetical protein